MSKDGMKKGPSRSLNFDIIAPFYDLGLWFISIFLGGEEKLRQEFIKAAGPLEGKRTLEIFAGTGTLSLLAFKYGAEAVATDVSAPMLRVAAVKSRKQGLPLSLVRADSTSLPFSETSFQLVLVCMGLHEVAPTEIEAALREAAALL